MGAGHVVTTSDISVVVDGHQVAGTAGQSLLAVLTGAGIRVLRYNLVTGDPRGAYCGMGACFECEVEVDGVSGVRACMELAVDGQRVRLGKPERLGTTA